MDVSLVTRARIALMRSAITRTRYIVQHKLFAQTGENFFFQPRIMPINAEYIKFHDNVSVASNVTFICHDVMRKVFNNIDPNKKVKKKYGCIEVMDNVFIGSNSTILYDVRIGPNSVVAAGSIVTKDVPPGTVVAGVPAKVIGKFEDLYEKRVIESNSLKDMNFSPEECWRQFYKKRDNAPTESIIIDRDEKQND